MEDGGRERFGADTSLGWLGTDERNLDRGCFQLDYHMYM